MTDIEPCVLWELGLGSDGSGRFPNRDDVEMHFEG